MTPKKKIAAYVLSLLLVLVEAGALAHELSHQLQKPDAPCAQCLFANHLGKAPVTVPFVSGACAPETFALPGAVPALHRHDINAYTARAPPLRSEV